MTAPPVRRPRPRRRLGVGRALPSLLIVLAVTALLMLTTGCSRGRRWHKHPRLMTEADVVTQLKLALQSELPDERRSAIHRIARTRYLPRRVVIDTFGTRARTDHSAAVRCAAVVALRKPRDPGVAATRVAILERDPPTGRRRSTCVDVRWEALRTILSLAQDGALPTDQRDRTRDVAAGLLGQDGSRDVRQTAARVLGFLQDRRVLDPLVDALEQRDFGVVYESERSLMRLTGRAFDYDAPAWREWLARTDDPLADAGKLDGLVDPPPKSWWQRSLERTRRTMASFQPKKGDS